MGILDNQFAQDLLTSFADGDIFGESITYTLGDTQQTFTFNAIVHRNPTSPVKGAGKPLSPAPALMVEIPIAAIPRRPAASSDFVTITSLVGSPPATANHQVTQILAEDGSGWVVALR